MSKTLVLGVTGSIAAFRAADLCSALRKDGTRAAGFQILSGGASSASGGVHSGDAFVKYIVALLYQDECDFSKGKRGPVIPRDPSKVRITIRLDADIVDYFKTPIERKSRMPLEDPVSRGDPRHQG